MGSVTPVPSASRDVANYEDELIDGLADALLGAFTGASTVIVDPSLKPRVNGTV
jgi:hypothetical protein